MTRESRGGARAIPVLVLALLVPAAWACGGTGSASLSPEDGEGRDRQSPSEGSRAQAPPVRVDVAGGTSQPVGSRLDLRLVLRNPSADALRLEFSDGQRFDFAVRDADGGERWRWSSGRFFTQALGSETVAPGDSLVYEATMEEGLEPGRYTVVGVVTARERTLRDSVEVEVGGRR